MNGKVVSVIRGLYSVDVNGVIFNVQSRGSLRHMGSKPMVGDNVDIDEECCVINKVYDRKNSFVRPLVANIDQLIIVMSLTEPDFSYYLLFKYITYANYNNVSSIVVLTKPDKYHDKDKILEINNVLKTLDIPTYLVNNKTKEGIEDVKKLFPKKVSCLMGQTGAGKSSLMNAINSEFNRAIGEYSDALGRGKHETKETILFPLENGFLADTPGFSSLELEITKEDLSHNFPGFNDLYLQCYYSNCLHITENKCKVKEAVENGLIPKIAYDCYLKLNKEIEDRSRGFKL